MRGRRGAKDTNRLFHTVDFSFVIKATPDPSSIGESYKPLLYTMGEWDLACRGKTVGHESADKDPRCQVPAGAAPKRTVSQHWREDMLAERAKRTAAGLPGFISASTTLLSSRPPDQPPQTPPRSPRSAPSAAPRPHPSCSIRTLSIYSTRTPPTRRRPRPSQSRTKRWRASVRTAPTTFASPSSSTARASRRSRSSRSSRRHTGTTGTRLLQVSSSASSSGGRKLTWGSTSQV